MIRVLSYASYVRALKTQKLSRITRAEKQNRDSAYKGGLRNKLRRIRY